MHFGEASIYGHVHGHCKIIRRFSFRYDLPCGVDFSRSYDYNDRIGVFLTTMLAYTLAQPHYIFRKIIGLIFVLTMYFNAGLFLTTF